jgi:hypothetical protein
MAIGKFNSNVIGTAAVAADATAPGPGSNGVHATATSLSDSAVYGEHLGNGIGVFGRGGADGGEGVFGQTASGFSAVYGNNTAEGPGVSGSSTNGIGVHGTSAQAGTPEGVNIPEIEGGIGVLGENQTFLGIGVRGQTNDGVGVSGKATTDGIAVQGISDSGTGVFGLSWNALGVIGASLNGIGVYGENGNVERAGNHPGVYGRAIAEDGVWATSNLANGLYAKGRNYAAYLDGKVFIKGPLVKPGGSFMIDHPLDPANKYLFHSFVESPDMKNVYDGVVALDRSGEAVVRFPEWFEALNMDFRYQLTAIGAPGPNLYIAEEVNSNQFKIAGGTLGVKVSWQVTGIRKDPWANAHRVQVEEDKPAEERGYYLDPASYGQSDEKDVVRVHYPVADTPSQLKKLTRDLLSDTDSRRSSF